MSPEGAVRQAADVTRLVKVRCPRGLIGGALTFLAQGTAHSLITLSILSFYAPTSHALPIAAVSGARAGQSSIAPLHARDCGAYDGVALACGASSLPILQCNDAVRETLGWLNGIGW